MSACSFQTDGIRYGNGIYRFCQSTGAGIGIKSGQKRNFEAGIIDE